MSAFSITSLSYIYDDMDHYRCLISILWLK